MTRKASKPAGRDDARLGSLIEALGPINNAARGTDGISKVELLWDLGETVLAADPEAEDKVLWAISSRSYITPIKSALSDALITDAVTVFDSGYGRGHDAARLTAWASPGQVAQTPENQGGNKQGRLGQQRDSVGTSGGRNGGPTETGWERNRLVGQRRRARRQAEKQGVSHSPSFPGFRKRVALVLKTAGEKPRKAGKDGIPHT